MWVLALITSTSCLSPVDVRPATPPSPPTSATSVIGNWLFHVYGAPFADEVDYIAVDTLSSAPGGWYFRSFSTRSWSGATISPFASDLGVGERLSNGEIIWLFDTAHSVPARMTWRMAGDTIYGRFALASEPTDTGYPLVGVRVSALVPPAAEVLPSGSGSASPVPMVLLKLADLPATDTAIIARMSQRGLYGELAIPTALIPGPDRATWSDVARWVGAGFGVAAHSRHHRAIESDQQFMDEVVGSLADLAARGYPTSVFAEPGSWQGSTNFDSIAKLQNWRGALLRTFTHVFEAYVRPLPAPLPLPESLAMGLRNWTISDGVSPAYILSCWKKAQSQNTFTIFAIHSANLPTPDTLDWFFDSVAVAVKAGRIRLAHTAADALTP